MAANEQTRGHHEELFHGRVSTLEVTDPELIEVFDLVPFIAYPLAVNGLRVVDEVTGT